MNIEQRDALDNYLPPSMVYLIMSFLTFFIYKDKKKKIKALINELSTHGRNYLHTNFIFLCAFSFPSYEDTMRRFKTF